LRNVKAGNNNVQGQLKRHLGSLAPGPSRTSRRSKLFCRAAGMSCAEMKRAAWKDTSCGANGEGDLGSSNAIFCY
jgi:hypothetical protein